MTTTCPLTHAQGLAAAYLAQARALCQSLMDRAPRLEGEDFRQARELLRHAGQTVRACQALVDRLSAEGDAP